MDRSESLMERFLRANAHRAPQDESSSIAPSPQLNLRVREYFDRPVLDDRVPQWLSRPELPTSNEVLDKPEDSTSQEPVVEIVPNRPLGAWASKDEYLSTQYELLREDALRPLREVIAQIRQTPKAPEESLDGTPGIYEKVHMCSLTCSTRGIAMRITFSLFRTGKKIVWEQSKRLITGSLVVLTPSDDMFRTKAIVATVAARPVAGLIQNPPELDLFIARSDDVNIDPAIEYVMVEERSGFYEADRHTLLALQHMAMETFPLAKYLVKVDKTTGAPQHVRDCPVMDLTSVLANNHKETYDQVDVLHYWPEQPPSDLDATQLEALHHILTRDLAIVQGPPGTGKTFVSVQAIKIMLANRQEGDPPIIIACQTNHAVDQILRHVATFEPDFIRFGGQTKDHQVIKPRTLFEVRRLVSMQSPAGCMLSNSNKRMRALGKEIGLLLAPLGHTRTAIDPELLQRFGLLTEIQTRSLIEGEKAWVSQDVDNGGAADSLFGVWLGGHLERVPHKQLPEDFGFEFEEADLEFEQLKETEAENAKKDDDDFETLVGTTYAIADNFTCKAIPGISVTKMDELMAEQDLWEIPPKYRGTIYRYLQTELKRVISQALRGKIHAYNVEAARRKIGNWERDEVLLNGQKIIGMTTTGLSKYRGLLAALEPKIVLIEEAAETLEAPVAVACMPSLQQLILVGDHQQLRPHCHFKGHEGKPYYFNVSLFERMVKNGIEYDALREQRRMIPEIRRILWPIYQDLILDHPSVLDPAERPDVPGMGGVNSFFFTHNWAEQRDESMSSYNPDEADMVANMVEYLFHNGTATEDITVLTFYNGQRKKILSNLRQRPHMFSHQFKVVTVDSYQGEENKVVLLSLVRSNDKGQIGFLANKNRVCVALSRARCGFYIFGNGQLLYGNKIWRQVITIMAGLSTEPSSPPPALLLSRIGEQLPIRCKKHATLTEVSTVDDWPGYGGCGERCVDTLPCGHACTLTCHGFEHDMVKCQEPCTRELPCGHGRCHGKCHDECECATCKIGPAHDRGFDNVLELTDRTAKTENWALFVTEQVAIDERKKQSRAVGIAAADEVKENNKPLPPPGQLIVAETPLESEVEDLIDFGH